MQRHNTNEMGFVQGTPEMMGSGLIPDSTSMSEFNLHIGLLGF